MEYWFEFWMELWLEFYSEFFLWIFMETLIGALMKTLIEILMGILNGMLIGIWWDFLIGILIDSKGWPYASFDCLSLLLWLTIKSDRDGGKFNVSVTRPTCVFTRLDSSSMVNEKVVTWPPVSKYIDGCMNRLFISTKEKEKSVLTYNTSVKLHLWANLGNIYFSLIIEIDIYTFLKA